MLGLSSLAVALPKQCYQHAVLNFDPKPVLARVDGSSTFGQVFNPSWIEPSAATGQRSGLLIRSQNCSAAVGGTCVRCFGAGQKASVLTFSQLIGSDNAGAASPRTVAVSAPHLQRELQARQAALVAKQAAALRGEAALDGEQPTTPSRAEIEAAREEGERREEQRKRYREVHARMRAKYGLEGGQGQA